MNYENYGFECTDTQVTTKTPGDGVHVYKSGRRTVAYRGCRDDAKADRRAEADIRVAGRKALSPEEQLGVLDRRLGFEEGATKERARLKALIQEAKVQADVKERKAKVKSDKKKK